MRKKWALWAGLLLIVAGGLLIAWAWLAQGADPAPPVSSSPEPIVPTRTPTRRAPQLPGDSSSTSSGAIPPTVSATEASARSDISPTPSPSTRSPTGDPDRDTTYRGRLRWGAGVAVGPISRYEVEPLRLGWYLRWGAQLDPSRPGGSEFVQMVGLRTGSVQPDKEGIRRIAEANPGSLWLVGNEPDVRWQDNAEPEAYARLYHEAYSAIKGADPTAQVAIGGVAQPTPLRLRYLERVLASYRTQFGTEMPVDVWNVHNFILREERDSWGVDIPPGLADDEGRLYEVGECDDMAIFRQQIVDFRQWMAERGYQDKPLIVSEYGIPMPEDYGFPPERIIGFLESTFDFFLTAADPALGYPEDDYRLVQRWCWFSLDAADDYYPTGRLFDPQTREMTAVGRGWVRMVEGLGAGE